MIHMKCQVLLSLKNNVFVLPVSVCLKSTCRLAFNIVDPGQFVSKEQSDMVLLCLFNSFSAKFQTTFIFVVCFFILTNYRLERRLYVKLKDWMSNSVGSDKMAQSAVSSGSMLFAKACYYRVWQWKS